MKTCEYKFRNQQKCGEGALPNSKYCILHVDFPEDEETEEFKRINGLKEEKVKDKENKGDFNFEGTKLFEVHFSNRKIEKPLNFVDTVIRKDALFDGTAIGGDAAFSQSQIGGNALFLKVQIGRDALFNRAKISGNVLFDRSQIGGNMWFVDAQISGQALFDGAEIHGAVVFAGAQIDGDVFIAGTQIDGNALFDETAIGGDAWFGRSEIKGRLSFIDAKFRKPEAQEEACRKAKRICEELGNRGEADYYFYREMEAKRRQKNRVMRLLELPIQYIFGYGTKWGWVLITWFSVVFSFAFLFWIGNGVEGANSLWESIYFSIVTATTLGYGDYRPKLGFYQGLASLEAIFGTFMWAAFIVIFARKYMK